MYEKLPNLVVGFHGCSKDTFNTVIHENTPLRQSDNTYDWLGNGIYFWENSLDRAWQWAKNHNGDDNAAVIGAVIDLGRCLNLTDSGSEKILQEGYELLKSFYDDLGIELPKNHTIRDAKDILLRDLDCAVIQRVQYMFMAEDEFSDTPFYDSVRGVFVEGERAYPGAEIYCKTHIQICVCNPNCIKGYFTPREMDLNYRMP